MFKAWISEQKERDATGDVSTTNNKSSQEEKERWVNRQLKNLEYKSNIVSAFIDADGHSSARQLTNN